MNQLKCIKCGKEIIQRESFRPDPVYYCPKCKRVICQMCSKEPKVFFEDLPSGCTGCGGEWFLTDLRQLFPGEK